MKDERTTIVLRLPKPLLRRLEARAAARRKELGVTGWSRNDEIVALLHAVTESRLGTP